MYEAFTVPCAVNYPGGNTAALTLLEGTPNIAIDGEPYYVAPDGSYRNKPLVSGGGSPRRIYRNAPPGDPSTGAHDGVPVTFSA